MKKFILTLVVVLSASFAFAGVTPAVKPLSAVQTSAVKDAKPVQLPTSSVKKAKPAKAKKAKKVVKPVEAPKAEVKVK